MTVLDTVVIQVLRGRRQKKVTDIQTSDNTAFVCFPWKTLEFCKYNPFNGIRNSQRKEESPVASLILWSAYQAAEQIFYLLTKYFQPTTLSVAWGSSGQTVSLLV